MFFPSLFHLLPVFFIFSMNTITFNTAVDGVDEAALLIALCFPCEQPRQVKTVDCTSQGHATPERLVWRFAEHSVGSGYTMTAARMAFHLPKRGAAASDIFQKARIAACNYQALKSAVMGAPLTVLEGSNYTLLRNGEGIPLQPLQDTTGATTHLPSVAIAAALGCRFQGAGTSLGKVHVLPSPGGPVSPQQVEAYGLTGEAAKAGNFSDLAVLVAMFQNRAELMRQAFGRRVVFKNGRRSAIVSAEASQKLINKAYSFIS